MSDRDLSLEQRLTSIEDKLDKLAAQVSQVAVIMQETFTGVPLAQPDGDEPRVFDGLDLARLPKHLQKTLLCLQAKGQATASEIAEATSKERAVESDYLNQLHIMGLVGKKRHKRSMIFFVANANREESTI
ncbi:MAG: transcriptional regulator [Candidatus Hodarchaeota archaeon]